MTLPICDICAKTGVLCTACESKLKKKEINALDIEISKILHKIGGGEIGFERAIEIKDTVVILSKKEDIGKIIGKNGVNIRTLSNKLKKQVRVVGTGSLKDTIYDFVSPARVIRINTVYKPDGSTTERVRIDAKDKSKLRMDVGDMEKLMSSVTESNIEITFE